MLVLGRKVGERLVIGDEIVVEVVRIQGNRVTLGVVAPHTTKILRSELLRHEVEPQKVQQQPSAATLTQAI